jgi:hypothetical protein
MEPGGPLIYTQKPDPWNLQWILSIQSTLPYLIYRRPILISTYYLVRSSDILPESFPIKILNVLLIFPTYATCLPHLILLDLIAPSLLDATVL